MKHRRINIAAAIIALLLGWGAARTDPGVKLDGLFFDHAAALLGGPRPAEELLVVLINEEDYTQAATPMALWGPRLATFLDVLAQAGPRAVGLDMVLPQFPLPKTLRDNDRVLMKALSGLSRQTRLVSGYGIAPDGKIRGPFPIYRKILGEDGYGYFNLIPDRDGVCRSQILALKGTGDQDLYSFAALLAGKKFPPGTVFTPDWRNPALIETMTFGQALEAGPGPFSGRIVLLGVNFVFEDRHHSPASEVREPGVVFHARVVEGLLKGRSLTDPGQLWSVLIPALLVVLAMFFRPSSSSPFKVVWTGLIATAVLCGLCLAALGCSLILRPVAGAGAVVCLSVFRLIHGYFFTREIFGQYLEPDVRDEVLSGRVPLDGELKDVSLIFSDLRDFTPLAESTPPTEVIRILNGYFKEMSEAIRGNGGLVMQYVGDEVFAAFGAPLPNPDHARLALKAGLEMQKRLERVNRNLARQGRQPLRHGIGIHTGTALAANIGGGDRLSYTLIGDAVNLASRIQELNKEFGTTLIVSGATRDLAGPEPGCSLRPLPPTTVKGKMEQVQLFEVVLETAPGEGSPAGQQDVMVEKKGELFHGQG